jgi:NADH:ubiquinone oxidoreductase subunit E
MDSGREASQGSGIFDTLLTQELSLNTVRICRSCTSINVGIEETEEFRQQVAQRLLELRPDLQFQIEPSPCLKVCPIGRVTMTVSKSGDPDFSQLTMSREANLQSVVQEILSFFKPRQ